MYKDFWKNKIKYSTKLDFYKKFKEDFTAEIYLDTNQTPNTKINYARFEQAIILWKWKLRNTVIPLFHMIADCVSFVTNTRLKLKLIYSFLVNYTPIIEKLSFRK